MSKTVQVTYKCDGCGVTVGKHETGWVTFNERIVEGECTFSTQRLNFDLCPECAKPIRDHIQERMRTGLAVRYASE